MTVEEIKAKLPEAEVYELRPDAKYLLVLDATNVSRSTVEGVLKGFDGMGLGVMVLRVYDAPNAVRLLEIREEPKDGHS